MSRTANSEYPWPTSECVQCGRTVSASRTDNQGRCAFCIPTPCIVDDEGGVCGRDDTK